MLARKGYLATRRARFCALVALCALLIPSLTIAADAVADAFLSDAELTSVCFANADRGWAVGDRGTIWQTRDGGRTWKLQPSPVPCRWEAVQFLDETTGFIVGASTQPHSHLTKAVMLKTRDGGNSWSLVRTDLLPGLRGVKFFDGNNGWVWGDSSSLYPSGVFRTNDGGQSWTPVTKGTTTSWIAGDFRDQRTGAVVGLTGELGLVAGVEIRPTRTSDLGLRYLRRMQFTAGLGGWLIGDGGLVLATKDSGFTWTTSPGELPAGHSQFDFRALAIHGSHCWIAGSPGTAVFHSADNGQTWREYSTGQFAPLHSLTFIDENRGWAVGSFGTILHTRDGGKSWRPQHSGGTRAAMLAVFSQPERIPWEVIASSGGNDGYLTVCEIIGRQDRDGQSAASATVPRRTHEAVVAVGGSAANTSWQFPLRSNGSTQTTASVLAYWNEFSDGRAARLATEHLVRRIRTWRPEVIVTEDVSPRGDDPLGHVTNQLVLSAVQLAADATFASEQISHAGLQAWKVKKVYSVQTNSRSGVITLSPAQWAPRLGGSIGEQAQRGSSLIHSDYERGPSQIGLSLLVDNLPQQTGRRDLFSGISLIPGGDARRELPEVVQDNLETLSRAAQKRHNVQQLLSQADQNDPASVGWLGQAEDLTKGLSKQSGGEVLFQLAQKYQQSGRTQSALDALQLLLDKYPQHPLADRAAVMLLQHAVSGEVAWRERKSTNFEVKLTTATTALEDPDQQPVIKAGAPLPRALGPLISRATGDSQQTTAAPQVSGDERSARAIAIGKQLEQSRPALQAEPSVRFPLAVAHRLAGNDRQAERLIDPFTNLGEQNPWAQAVAAEHWRRHTNGLPPKKLLTCVTAAGPPQLDGRLDDPLWRTAKPITLRTAAQTDEAWPAAVVAAWDREFLYLAMSCAKAPGVKYATDDRPRPRDSDLAPHDHVQIYLDIDRDYATSYQLSVDSRGFTAESCVGDSTWNPSWFVAAAGDERYWTAEIAIPWRELCSATPQPKDLWAVGIQRLVPGQPVQSFTHPATAKVRPEGFGLWLFE
ncbi:Ycf48-like protein precursor [Anatilimnocola aggregata]|uniref:Ycf48-like protein n=1 Tax=Anatilimnocola aggregata TaxID=2528021 RepID=A0A517YNN7_9BACT|nr:YCF48-related protein [Anatilimnocola aggregata]QDU31843.1 Ycf48-like protein precursor [Anatilimnocola aggregata]